MPPLIPEPDPIPLPAPVWLLKSLLILTFVLHLLPMNLVLGGSMLCFLSHLKKAKPEHRVLAERIGHLLPLAVAFTVTLGIAPLLFVQVLYGPLFYSSSVIMAWPWLAVIFLLLLAYYGVYLHSLRFAELGSWRAPLMAASALLFLSIAFLFSHNLILMQTPERFQSLYQQAPSGWGLDFELPTLLPRLIHFVVASLALSGLALAFLGSSRSAPAEWGGWVRRYGARWFTYCTAVQFLAGGWLLMALDREARAAFLGASPADTALLAGALALALAAVALVLRSQDGRRLLLASFSITGTLVLMGIIRQRVRTISLSEAFVPESLPVSSQLGVIAMFLAALTGGLAVVGWMVLKLARGTERPAPRP